MRLVREYCLRSQVLQLKPLLSRTIVCRNCSQHNSDDNEQKPKGYAKPQPPSEEHLKRYERFGVRVVKDDGLAGTTRREGVTGDVMPAVEEYKSPFRLMKLQKERGFTGKLGDACTRDPMLIPRETDIAIIGGGIMGSAVAYWLKQRNPNGFNLHIIERDDNVSFESKLIYDLLTLPQRLTPLSNNAGSQCMKTLKIFIYNVLRSAVGMTHSLRPDL